jgi:hypothetical protein
MQYKIRKLDGRYSYREFFKYCIVFKNTMVSANKDVEAFNDCVQWFTKTYGPSAEIRQWSDIHRYYYTVGVSFLDDTKMPDYVNRNWSWTNGYDDLRIYVKSGKVLTMFKLAHSESQ